MTDSYLLDTASIDWDEGTPVAGQYQDIYWHRGAALDEKRRVFIDPLIEQAGATRSGQVTVVELGFGFGINCLLAA